jgi:hypothetical protein
LTSSATHEVRRLVAWRVARNAFFVLVSALLLGSLILSLYGISIPVLRVAGGFIVAVAGWKLLSEGSQKELEATADGHHQADPLDLAFYPLTLPLRPGPGPSTDEAVFVIASLCAIFVIAAAIFVCSPTPTAPAPVGAGWHRYRRAALGFHSLLPRYPDPLVGRKRAVAFGDASTASGAGAAAHLTRGGLALMGPADYVPGRSDR